MSCRHYKNDILESIRNHQELTGDIRAHIQQCSDCRAYFESEQQLTGMLRTMKAGDQDFRIRPSEDLLHALRQKKQRSFTGSFWMKAAAIFIISLLSGSYWIYRSEYRQNPGDQKNTTVTATNPNDYLPLTYGMAQDEPLQKVRVKLPRSALNDFGITLKQVRSEEVTADLIVGQSGIPYAIRVVQQ